MPHAPSRKLILSLLLSILFSDSSFAFGQNVGGASVPAPLSGPAPTVAPHPEALPAPTVVAGPATAVKSETPLSTEEVKTLRSLLEKNKTFAFGVSIGPRYLFDYTTAARSAAVVVPGKIDAANADRVDMVLSGVVIARPFSRPCLKWLGFLAKLDLAQLDTARVSGPKSIDGGIGIAFQLNEYFSLGLSFDRVYTRSLRNEAGKINDAPDTFLMDSDGKKISSVSLGDDRYFVDNYLSGASFMLIFLP